jgi:hypothetical protein
MAETIGTTNIPSDEITIDASATVSIGLAFSRSTGFVGGMDTSNGSASAGTIQTVSNPTDAKNLFGQDSELHRAAKIAFQPTDGVSIDTLYAVGVSETDETESFTSSSSGTLGNTPAMDPNLHGDEDLTAQDDQNNDITVNIVYGTPQTPSDADTINLNPLTGDWEADASDDYDISYTYGDYQSAIDELLSNEAPRTVAVGAEDSAIITDLISDGTENVNNEAGDFNFMHGFGGVTPVGDNETTSTYVSGYSDSFDEKRLSLVAPPRGFTDTDGTEARTVWGEAAAHAAVPLGDSRTKSPLSAYESLRSDFDVSGLETLIDSQVMPLRDLSPVENVKDMTTSQTAAFERVYANQIADDATERLHIIARNFIGSNFNTEAARRRLGRSLRNEYLAMQSNTPPLLDDFDVQVDPDSTNDNQVDVTVGLDIVDLVDTIDAEVSVGDVITNETE